MGSGLGGSAERLNMIVRHHLLASAAVVVSMGLERVAIVLVILAGSTFLAAIGKVDSAAVVGLYMGVLGYIFGRVQQGEAPERKG